VLTILDEAKHAYKEKGEDAGKQLTKWAHQSQKKERLSAMLELAKSDLAVHPDDLDKDPWLFNCENGVLDLYQGVLWPHHSDDLLTKIAPVTFDWSAEAPRWEDFIEEVTGGDEELSEYLQRFFGYSLTADISEQYLPILCGSGANGKSTFIETIMQVMGDYAGWAAPDLLTDTNGSNEHPTELADLEGKRLVAVSESEKNRKLRVQRAKRLTGDRVLKARRMRQDYYTFERGFKVGMVTNNQPTVDEDTEAAWRRLRLVPFSATIPEDQRDPKLPEKLAAEAAGILVWLVQGCIDWQIDGLGEPEVVQQATGRYRAQAEPVTGFIDQWCGLEAGAWVPTEQLREAFEDYVQTQGHGGKPSEAKLWAALRQRGCQSERRNEGRGWAGVRLKTKAYDAA
jgi:putative DNA primase/helicase